MHAKPLFAPPGEGSPRDDPRSRQDGRQAGQHPIRNGHLAVRPMLPLNMPPAGFRAGGEGKIEVVLRRNAVRVGPIDEDPMLAAIDRPHRQERAADEKRNGAREGEEAAMHGIVVYQPFES